MDLPPQNGIPVANEGLIRNYRDKNIPAGVDWHPGLGGGKFKGIANSCCWRILGFDFFTEIYPHLPSFCPWATYRLSTMSPNLATSPSQLQQWGLTRKNIKAYGHHT